MKIEFIHHVTRNPTTDSYDFNSWAKQSNGNIVKITTRLDRDEYLYGRFNTLGSLKRHEQSLIKHIKSCNQSV